MINIDSSLIITEAEKQNPWWVKESAVLEEAKKTKRDIYNELKGKIVNTNLVTAIVGLRRVGKTTIIKQIISDLLESGFYKSKIIYFSFEEYLQSQYPEFLQGLIEIFLAKYPDEKLYFFLDEIQYVDFWNAILKKYVDLYPKIKFVVSGSSSLFIKTKAKESLAGRIQEITMHPLSFSEYLKLKYEINLEKGKDILEHSDISLEIRDIQQKFTDYISFGEFPYLYKLESQKDKLEYLKTWVIGKVVENDLPQYQRIIKTSELSLLLNALIEGNGQVVELQNLATDLGIAQNTLVNYLHLLEKTLLINQIYYVGLDFKITGIDSTAYSCCYRYGY